MSDIQEIRMTSEEELVECQVCENEFYEHELCSHSEHIYCRDCCNDANETIDYDTRNDLD